MKQWCVVGRGGVENGDAARHQGHTVRAGQSSAKNTGAVRGWQANSEELIWRAALLEAYEEFLGGHMREATVHISNFVYS